MSTATATIPTVQAEQQTPAASAKLVRPRDQALLHLQNQLRRGMEIKALRIRTGNELDRARATKLEWTTRTIELLGELFADRAVADECNDWVGKIYPEYAEFGNFVEQFYAEMDHRLRRLRAVIKRIEKDAAEGNGAIGTIGAIGTEIDSDPEQESAANGNPLPAAPAVSHKPKPASQAPQPAPQLFMLGLLVACNADEQIKQSVVEFFESLDIESVLVEDTSGMAEALDRQGKIQFAVILSAGDSPDHNFELGFCAGRLGLKRVYLLHPQPPASPDGRGLTHVMLDTGGGWQLQLARHFKRAGLDIDLNRLC